MSDVVERAELAPGFSVSRVLTGLWQVADMERDGTVLDPVAGAAAMQRSLSLGRGIRRSRRSMSYSK